jgi:Sec-independent protein translocase protein TatA
MEILGIGPFEFVLILLIALMMLGPGDMAKTGRTIGRFLRRIVTSEWWNGFQKASREVRQLPYTLMREANIEDVAKELKNTISIGNYEDANPGSTLKQDFAGWITSPSFIQGKTGTPNPEKQTKPTSPSESSDP